MTNRNWKRAKPRDPSAKVRKTLKSGLVFCVGCGTDISNSFRFDHIIPAGRGGLDGPPNLQLLCSSCNADKSDRTMIEWLADKYARCRSHWAGREHEAPQGALKEGLRNIQPRREGRNFA